VFVLFEEASLRYAAALHQRSAALQQRSCASDAWRSSSATQRLKSNVPNVRVSLGKVAAFAAMSGAGPPLLAKVQTSLPDSQLHGPSFFKQGSTQCEPQCMAAPVSGSWGFTHDPRETKP